MKTHGWDVTGTVAVSLFLLISQANGQSTPGGGRGTAIGVDGKPPYKLTDPTWSFEATTEWYQGSADEVYRTERVIRHQTQGTRIDVWQFKGMGPIHARANRRADNIYLHTPQISGFVWESTPATTAAVFRPTRASCLNALLQEARMTGNSAVEQKYNLPSYVKLDEPWDILGEVYIGAKQGKRGERISHFGINFLVNDYHSGFGWPPLMFSLPVFDEAYLKTTVEVYRADGEEMVAGVKCRRYITDYKGGAVTGKTTYWVEPKTRLVLQEETTQRSVPAGGSRMPPRTIRSGHRTVRFRLLNSTPSGAFNLPAGSTVELPQSLYRMSLPANIKRRPLKGYESVVGFPLKPYPSGGAVVVK